MVPAPDKCTVLGICKWLVRLLKKGMSQRTIDKIEADVARLFAECHYSWISDRSPIGVFKYTGMVQAVHWPSMLAAAEW